MSTQKVLIVDDIEDNILIVSSIISSDKVSVLEANDGATAIEIAKQELPDLILLDISMPVMDGFQACEKLKAMPETKDIPVIFLTALNQTDSLVRGFELGAVDYVTKPFNMSELLSRVATHLELKKNKNIIEKQNAELKQEIEQRKIAEKAVKESEEKFRSLTYRLDEVIFRISLVTGKYEYINPAAKKVFGYSEDDFYNTPFFLKKMLHPDFYDYYQSRIDELKNGKVSDTLEYKVIDKYGKHRWIIQSNKAVFDEKGNIIQLDGIARNITEQKIAAELLEKQKEELELTNKEITSSINYARMIQKAVLPSMDFFLQYIPENFILNMPRDIVSGDFYWMRQVENQIIIAAADCTGHGIPGAFMSMLGIASLNEIVNNYDLKKGLRANEILNLLRKQIKLALHQDGVRDTVSDGMDIALCIINLEQKTMQFSGANHPLYIIRKNKETAEAELIVIKPDKMPIAIYLKEKPFTNNNIDLQTGDVLYMFSDGYKDQFGGIKNTKFLSKRFKKLLLEISNLPVSEQKQILYKTFKDWTGDQPQVDDVLIIGMRISSNYGDIDTF